MIDSLVRDGVFGFATKGDVGYILASFLKRWVSAIL